MNEPSIFTQIINGDIPCYKIYEDANSLAFLDIHPIQPGQVLVVPKKQIDFVWNMPTSDYLALMSTVHKVGQRMGEIFPDKSRVGVVIEGLGVADHAHVKVFPFSNVSEFRNVPDIDAEPDHAALERIAQQLAF